jgi:nitrogen-specific signal transduction histidine kinase
MLLDGPLRLPGDSLIAESRQTTALGVLEGCPIPVVAAADDGTVLFANAAFAHFFDFSSDSLTCMSHQAICSALPADETLVAVTRLGPNAMKSLALSGQVTVFVKMCKSATFTSADPDAIAMFRKLMKYLSR